MKTSVLCFVVLTLSTSTTFGQAATEKGSPAAWKSIMNAQRSTIHKTPGGLSPPFTVGDVGTMGRGYGQVIQVVDEQHAIVSVSYSPDFSQWFWVAISTAALADDQSYIFTTTGTVPFSQEALKTIVGGGKPSPRKKQPKHPVKEKELPSAFQRFKITGTKTYTTAAGSSKTLFVLEPESTPVMAAKEKASPVSRPAAEMRTWATADGKFSVDAVLVKAIGDFVWLKKKDDSTIKVAKEKLSEGDLEYVRNR